MNIGDPAIRPENKVALLRGYVRDLFDTLDSLGPSREVSIAKTKLEEALMWAEKHITR